MSHKPYQSSLARLIPNQIDPEEIKRKGWQNDGIFVVSADDHRLSWPEKELINQIATKLYGNHKTKEDTTCDT